MSYILDMSNIPSDLKKKKRLTKRERVFADEYALTGILVDSYLLAGFKEATNHIMHGKAKHLANTLHVMQHIESCKQMIVERHSILEVNVIAGFNARAYYDPRDYFDSDGDPIPMHQLTKEQAQAIKSYKVIESEFGVKHEYIFHDRLPALVNLAKITNMYGANNRAAAPKITLNLGKKEVINVIEHNS